MFAGGPIVIGCLAGLHLGFMLQKTGMATFARSNLVSVAHFGGEISACIRAVGYR
jgi:hypothetical protein